MAHRIIIGLFTLATAACSLPDDPHSSAQQPIATLTAPVSIEEANSSEYKVKIRVALPRGAETPPELYVGGKRKSEFGGWKHGIYFKVRSAKELAALEGAEVVVRSGGKNPLLTTKIDLRNRVPKTR